MASILTAMNGIEAQLEGMIKRANLVPGYLGRVVYRQYQVAQRERWASENNSGDFLGGQWDALDPSYAVYKRKKFAQYDGAGTKTLIATKRLFDSVVGPSPDHVRIIEGNQIIIATTVPYAKYVDEHRTFTKFSPVFYKRVLTGLSDYIRKNL